MRKKKSSWASLLLILAAGPAWGQSGEPQSGEAAPQQPAPAYGPQNPVGSVADNPPISGLDLPNLEPHAAPLSYLQPGVHVSESVDSNVQNSLGGSTVRSVSQIEGSVKLQRLWSNYDLTLDYLGGVGYFDAPKIGLKQVQQLGVGQKISWKRGSASLRDSFSYQPEGTFGGSYGSVGETGSGLAGQSVFFGGSALGALGQVPRIVNLAVLDAVESLTPKSSVTAVVGYSFVHFFQNQPGTNTGFIGSSEVSGQLGYNRILGPKDQVAFVYGYQGFNFSTGTTFHSNVLQLVWGHRISGRMDFVAGAGPQFTQINHLLTPATAQNANNPNCVAAVTSGGMLQVECPTNELRISAAGRASLRYRFPKTIFDLSYDHYLTNGAGFFAGATSDVVRLSASRPLNRIWSTAVDLGYSHNTRVVANACSTLQVSGSCPGVNADNYQFGFAGFSLHRMFGRTWHGYASYQFNELKFDSSLCQTSGPCSRTSQRNVGTVGLDWTPRPIRLD